MIDDFEREGAPTADETTPEGAKLSTRHDGVASDLTLARDKAGERLARAVSALETIRLQLLRLHAGAGSVDALTQDLSHAVDVSEEIEHLLSAREEVDALLEPSDTSGRV